MISCVIPKLRSETLHRLGMQVFEKTQCLYIVRVNSFVSVYYHVTTHVLVKRQLGSRQSQLEKDSGGESGVLNCVYRQKDNCIQTESVEIAFCENTCFSCP